MGAAESHQNPATEDYSRAARRLDSAELSGVKELYHKLAARDKETHNKEAPAGSGVSARAFKLFFQLEGQLGFRLFTLLARNRTEGGITFQDLVIAKSVLESSDPEESQKYAYQILDVNGDGPVTRDNVHVVVGELMREACGCSPSYESLDAIVRSAFVCTVPGSHSVGHEVLTLELYKAWITSVPAVHKALTLLLTEPGQRWPLPRLCTIDGQPLQTSMCGVPADSLIMRPEYAWQLAAALRRDQCECWRLVYSSTQHGTSFARLLAQTSESLAQVPTIMMIKESGSGYVFGGFGSAPWTKHSDFYGDMHSFVFSLLPVAAIYKPTGFNENFQWCAVNFQSEQIPNGIGFGGKAGHFGLFISESFENGVSRPSATFDSPCLSSHAKFSFSAIEIWAVELPESMKGLANLSSRSSESVLERFKEDQHVLNMLGIGGHSQNVGPVPPFEEDG